MSIVFYLSLTQQENLKSSRIKISEMNGPTIQIYIIQ